MTLTNSPVAADYAICPEIEGTQVVRTPATGRTDDPGFAVRCRCGFKAGPYVGVEMTSYDRSEHEDVCLWPKS